MLDTCKFAKNTMHNTRYVSISWPTQKLGVVQRPENQLKVDPVRKIQLSEISAVLPLLLIIIQTRPRITIFPLDFPLHTLTFSVWCAPEFLLGLCSCPVESSAVCHAFPRKSEKQPHSPLSLVRVFNMMWRSVPSLQQHK